jgi:hypothetical protein
MHASLAMVEPRPVEKSPDTADARHAIRELLDVLPKDVLDELNVGTIDLNDPAFLDGLMDHVSRLAIARPAAGQKLLGKIIRLKKLIAKSVRESDPNTTVSSTVVRQGQRLGRNAPCPCGSGRKYKQCCLRKT